MKRTRFEIPTEETKNIVHIFIGIIDQKVEKISATNALIVNY